MASAGRPPLRCRPNTGWQWDRDTIRRDGQLLATETPGGLHHYHLDHLGTPRLITDAEADPVVWHDLLPFGEEPPAPTVPADPQPYRFTGHERDRLHRLVQCRSRLL